jgi:hypothetical protein
MTRLIIFTSTLLYLLFAIEVAISLIHDQFDYGDKSLKFQSFSIFFILRVNMGYLFFFFFLQDRQVRR